MRAIRPGTRGAKMRAIREVMKREDAQIRKVQSAYSTITNLREEIERLKSEIPVFMEAKTVLLQYGHEFPPLGRIADIPHEPVMVKRVDLEGIRITLSVHDDKMMNRVDFTISGYAVRRLQNEVIQSESWGRPVYPVVEHALKSVVDEIMKGDILGALVPRRVSPEERELQAMRDSRPRSLHPMTRVSAVASSAA